MSWQMEHSDLYAIRLNMRSDQWVDDGVKII